MAELVTQSFKQGELLTATLPRAQIKQQPWQAICVDCGDLACRNQRLINGRPARWDSPTIMVGGSESYEARYRRCHRVPRQDEDQTVMI